MGLSRIWTILFAFGWAVYGNKLPTVDLGYQVHQAIAYNVGSSDSPLSMNSNNNLQQEAVGFYNFSNIRYARPPTGNLRFAPPEPPLKNRTSVQTGSVGGTCAQSFPVWYLCGRALLSGAINSTDDCNASLIPRPDPTEQEDCLFLDVIVPQKIFVNARKSNAKGAAVMVWVYGGGFTFGKKYDDGDPSGLIKRSQEEDPNGKGVIYVIFNYRVNVTC